LTDSNNNCNEDQRFQLKPALEGEDTKLLEALQDSFLIPGLTFCWFADRSSPSGTLNRFWLHCSRSTLPPYWPCGWSCGGGEKREVVCQLNFYCRCDKTLKNENSNRKYFGFYNVSRHVWVVICFKSVRMNQWVSGSLNGLNFTEKCVNQDRWGLKNGLIYLLETQILLWKKYQFHSANNFIIHFIIHTQMLAYHA
jgi:hypothetical protein